MPVSTPESARRWGVRLTTLALWAAAAASLAFWALKLTTPGASALPTPAAPPALTVDAAALARVLGAQPQATPDKPGAGPAPQRLVLHGVLAGQHGNAGAALIALDGAPPKTYRIGAQVAPNLQLLTLARHQAHLGPHPNAPASLVLEVRNTK